MRMSETRKTTDVAPPFRRRRGPVRGLGRWLEKRFEQIIWLANGRGSPLLDPYRGFATPRSLIVRGRVLTALRRTAPEPEHGKWTNLRQMVSLFLTNEVAGVQVTVPEKLVTGKSDAEGYLWLEVPRQGFEPGWREIAVEIAGRPESRRGFPVLIPSSDARFGVISDIDDTMIETGSYSLVRNLWTTFTGSTLTRHVYPDAVTLMKRLHDGVNPVYYVSSSPWNLHHFLVRIFTQAGLTAGPMFLRDLGLGSTAGHRDHKSEAIDAILSSNPDLPFVLLGDTGQKDAFVYRDAIARHPGRIAMVILREPVVGAPAASLKAIAEIESTGTPCHHSADFESVRAPVLPLRSG